jgi:hypothetical protein
MPDFHLLTEKHPTHALIDAARTFGLPAFVTASKLRTESLYDGESAEQLRDFAPYLVELGDPEVTRLLFENGWGRAWGIYLCCAESFDHLRRHLRRFLRVKAENGEEMFFRFYDPRVLRVFLPECTPQERDRFFGPVTAFAMESEDGQTCLTFRNEPA